MMRLRKAIILFTCSAALLFLLMVLMAVEVKAQSTQRLQELIDDTPAGAILELPAGRYEGLATIAKPITITTNAGGDVILSSDGGPYVLDIAAHNVTLKGVSIEFKGEEGTSALTVNGDNVILDELNIETNVHGIKLEESQHATIRNSVITSTSLSDIKLSQRGNGIELFNSNDAQLIGNTISAVYDGIYLENSHSALIADNFVERSRYGIHCMYTNAPTVRNNVGSRNITGGMIMGAEQAVVVNNRFVKQSESVNSQGILLYDTHHSLISGNEVEGNRIGLYVEASTQNDIIDNDVSLNFIGLQLLETEMNKISGNQFIGNVADAAAKESVNNEMNGNFWDGFSGIDTDGDGYSDTRYAVNPLFQSLSQRRPPFQLLFQSPGMVFLESLYASDQSAWATDYTPLMEPKRKIGRLVDDRTSEAAGFAGMLLILLASSVIILSRRKLT